MQCTDGAHLDVMEFLIGVVLADEENAGTGKLFRHFLRRHQLAGTGIGDTVQNQRDLPALAAGIPDFHVQDCLVRHQRTRRPHRKTGKEAGRDQARCA
jgi:hypothetical protein